MEVLFDRSSSCFLDSVYMKPYFSLGKPELGFFPHKTRKINVVKTVTVHSDVMSGGQA